MLSAVAVAGFAALTARAESVDKPVFYPFTFSDNAILSAMSKNGEWALAKEGSSEVETGSTPKLVNLTTMEVIELCPDTAIACDVNAVTNDGAIVVGSYMGKPAYWSKATGEWKTLSCPAGWSGGGYVTDVTPDGKRAVGVANAADDVYKEKPVAWDLTTDKRINLSNLPKKDMTHENQNQCRFTAITPDGRYALGCMSFSYISPAELFEFVYDIDEQEYTVIGFDEDDNDDWNPHVDNLYYIDGGYFSPNGQWATGMAYIAELNSGSEFPNEYYAAYSYNVETGDITVLNKLTADIGYMGVSIDNDGVIYGATPVGDPIREFTVRSGKYWFTFSQILSQYYGMDFEAVTGFSNTGTPIAVSEDGKRILSMVDPRGSSYVVDLPVSLVEACKHINLLSSYTAEPASGSIFSKLRTVYVNFDRDIDVVGSKTSVVLKDSDGKVVRNSSAVAVSSTSDKTLRVDFRTTTLEDGKTYTITIPAGTVCVAGDNERPNEEITLTYTGRVDEAVKVTNIYPANGTKLPKIDASESPILLTFNAIVALPDTAVAYLYRDDQASPVATLNLASSDSRVAVYPSNTQYLYDGSTYRVVVPAGSVTDIMGDNGCDSIVLNYVGTYERTISQTDSYLFQSDFNDMSTSLATFMLYEGDHNTPQAELIENYEFDTDNTPWNFSLRESNTTTDYFATSHSMYTNLGKSDDWMVIPQLYLPDATCQLFFDAQSYRAAANDSLTVIVWASDVVYNVVTDAMADSMKQNGTVVFNQRLNVGSDEETVEGDWTNYYVSLKDFAGKSVYIAFVNRNENASMVFVDNVKVVRDMKFSISLKTDAIVVAQTEQSIAGTITIESQEDVYNSYSLVLKDGNGNEVDRIAATNVELKKGDRLPFEFAKALPLTLAEVNNFTIEVTLGDYSELVKSSIQNNAFRPTKRVVLEEFTGVTCGNCPLGILAIENIEKTVGDQFIPISLHAYTGDPWASASSGYASYFGFSAAPSGMVQRSGTISSPMYTTGGYYFTSPNGDVWYDLVMQELEEVAMADISASMIADSDKGTLTIPVTVKYALNATDLNFNIFAVVLEDNVTYIQENYLASTSDPNLGEWGAGGKYGSTYAVVQHNDVVRQVVGLSYAGTGGLLPQEMTAGEEYNASIPTVIPTTLTKLQNAKVAVLLIDANTGAIVNACVARAPQTDNSAIETITATGNVTAVEVYGLNGVRVATAPSFEAARLGLGTGVYVVRSQSANGTKVQKVVIK
jgi:hypothetical protein